MLVYDNMEHQYSLGIVLDVSKIWSALRLNTWFLSITVYSLCLFSFTFYSFYETNVQLINLNLPAAVYSLLWLAWKYSV